MPKIMEVEIGDPGRAQCLEPCPLPEMAVPQRLSGRAGEDEPFVAWLREAAQVPADHRNDHVGNRDYPPACLRLGRPEFDPSSAYLGQLPFNPHGARVQVDVAPAEPGQFAPPKAAEHRQEHQCAVPLADRLGEREDLRDRESRPLRWLLLSGAFDAAWVAPDGPVVGGGGEDRLDRKSTRLNSS